jgi:hypothetical protein
MVERIESSPPICAGLTLKTGRGNFKLVTKSYVYYVDAKPFRMMLGTRLINCDRDEIECRYKKFTKTSQRIGKLLTRVRMYVKVISLFTNFALLTLSRPTFRLVT